MCLEMFFWDPFVSVAEGLHSAYSQFLFGDLWERLGKVLHLAKLNKLMTFQDALRRELALDNFW